LAVTETKTTVLRHQSVGHKQKTLDAKDHTFACTFIENITTKITVQWLTHKDVSVFHY